VPRERSQVAEVVAALDASCGAIGVRWYLFGAQAALLYGSARLTADVDATVLLGDVSTETLVEALKTEGFELRIDDPEFVAATRVIPVVHGPTGLPADIVLGGPGLEELFLARAHTRSVGGAPVPVVAAEDLVAMKILAGREKDRQDIVAILRAGRGTLDLSAIRATIEMLESALAQSDLMPLFEELQRRAVS
jgi:hypothetical protein